MQGFVRVAATNSGVAPAKSRAGRNVFERTVADENRARRHLEEGMRAFRADAPGEKGFNKDDTVHYREHDPLVAVVTIVAGTAAGSVATLSAMDDRARGGVQRSSERRQIAPRSDGRPQNPAEKWAEGALPETTFFAYRQRSHVPLKASLTCDALRNSRPRASRIAVLSRTQITGRELPCAVRGPDVGTLATGARTMSKCCSRQPTSGRLVCGGWFRQLTLAPARQQGLHYTQVAVAPTAVMRRPSVR